MLHTGFTVLALAREIAGSTIETYGFFAWESDRIMRHGMPCVMEFRLKTYLPFVVTTLVVIR